QLFPRPPLKRTVTMAERGEHVDQVPRNNGAIEAAFVDVSPLPSIDIHDGILPKDAEVGAQQEATTGAAEPGHADAPERLGAKLIRAVHHARLLYKPLLDSSIVGTPAQAHD